MIRVPIDIVTCREWGARQPRHGLTLTRAADKVIVHHTAGHHAEVSLPANESREEAIGYARAVQAFHMDVNGWTDSGHNFLVCRNGLILQGRWLTVSAIEADHMVVSAHCPGQNGQVGIEHEHAGAEAMTAAQIEASARLQAWVAGQYGRRHPLPAYPHSQYFATACPANLREMIPALVSRAQRILDQAASS